jgi:ERF superfamily
MHRSSESIATIAAALAKAQVELTNPEKSLVATIRSPFPREADRTFRYAPLSSGLDIVRKGLGRHEIATIQSTVIDKEAGLLRLTTILAHSSGEWVSSEWPVCQITEISSAQRMGAALTYARRYALFTLVGIAGENDLDAPDLGAESNAAAEPPRPPDNRQRSNGQAPGARHPAPNDQKLPRPSAQSVLGEQLSASLRKSLIEQMAAINSEDEAAAWAHRNLPAKNTLTAADAKMVEERFQARLSTISNGVAPGALGKTVRLRDKDHRKFVLRQPCLVCGRVPSDPHHLTFTQPRALGRRVSDEFTVPLCRVHHRELHLSGNESAWWHRLNIDPLPVALKLWQQSRADGELFSSIEGVTQAPAAKTPDVSAPDQSGTGRDPNVHPGSAV